MSDIPSDYDGTPRRANRLLLIAWLSADWARLHPHIDAGRMPHLAALIARGTMTSLASTAPLTRECLMTALATGCLADRHGVLAPLQIRADGGGVEAVGRRSWCQPAVWDLLSRAGLRTACVNWPATAPADAAPGLCVDENFATATGGDFTRWAMPPHCVSSPNLAAALAPLRVHPADDLAAFLAEFGPETTGQPASRRAEILRAALARTITVHAAASHIAETAAWDLLCVSHDFLHNLLPAFADAPRALQQAITLLDMMLGRLVHLAGPAATILLVSPNGVAIAPDGAIEGRPRGLLVAAGPGIAADASLPGLRLVDVAPSILAHFGLTADTDGTPVSALAPATGALRPIPHPAPDPAPAWTPEADLLAAGYRDALSPAQTRAIDQAEHIRLLHLGIALMARGDLPAASQALQAALARQPTDYQTLRRLARCRARMGDYAACRPLGEAMLAIDPFQPWGHLALASWAMLGAEDAALAAPYLASARELGADRPGVLVRLGGLELIAGRDAVAAADFEAALARDPAAADAAYGAGLAHHRLGNHAAAEKLLRQAVMLEHHMPLAHAHLGVALAALGRHEDAILSLTTAHAQSGDVHIAAMLSRAREALAHSLARNAIATAARAETRAVP